MVVCLFTQTHLCSCCSPLSYIVNGAPHLPHHWFWILSSCHPQYTFITLACKFTKLIILEMPQPLTRKSMIMSFWMLNKSLCFYITPIIAAFPDFLRYPLYILYCNILPSAFCDWLFHINMTGLCVFIEFIHRLPKLIADYKIKKLLFFHGKLKIIF